MSPELSRVGNWQNSQRQHCQMTTDFETQCRNSTGTHNVLTVYDNANEAGRVLLEESISGVLLLEDDTGSVLNEDVSNMAPLANEDTLSVSYTHLTLPRKG